MGNELPILSAMIGGVLWMREETRGLRTHPTIRGGGVVRLRMSVGTLWVSSVEVEGAGGLGPLVFVLGQAVVEVGGGC
jgi:hypothetical protein